ELLSQAEVYGNRLDSASPDGAILIEAEDYARGNVRRDRSNYGAGIGVLVVAAERVSRDLPVPIVFVGFGAEEFQPAEPRVHHLGSQDYVARRGGHVLAAFVVDMVGHGPSTCICWFDAGPRTLADRLRVVAAEGELGPFRVEARGDISDHGPFARAGLPAAFLWTYDDGRLHTANDTAEHLQVEALERAGGLLLAFVDSLVAADLAGLRAEP
ncbi:MAG: M28 family peptidase, partial [Nitriliruptorales bacterium]|nr:M28 family peptidase [Nitriliruptorales bacterium]